MIEPGQIIGGRYRVDAFLGEGGMARVYKVFDTKRAVYLAMKQLREDFALDAIFLRRFTREAQTLANLRHPHILQFYGLEQDNHIAFILTNYVDGITLKREIFATGGEPLANARILEVMRAICSAVYYAHQNNFVHCDLKPGNIMIDRTGQIFVADFGIARMAEGAATVTMVGAGTPAYMAPEQILGKDPAPENDIYSLGVILYEMLTGGERPFMGDTAPISGTQSNRVRWEQMNADAPPPSRFNENISPELDAINLKCLAKEAKDRYSSTLDLLNDLEKVLGFDQTTSDQAVETSFTADKGVVESILQSDARAVQMTRIAKVRGFMQKNWKLVLGGLGILLVGFIAVGQGRDGRGPMAFLATPTPTMTPTMTPTPTATSTKTPTITPTPTNTLTPTITPTPTNTSTPTITPTRTNTPRPTSTPAPAKPVIDNIDWPMKIRCNGNWYELTFTYHDDDGDAKIISMWIVRSSNHHKQVINNVQLDKGTGRKTVTVRLGWDSYGDAAEIGANIGDAAGNWGEPKYFKIYCKGIDE